MFSHSQQFAPLFNPQNATCFGGELLRQHQATHTREVGDIGTWTVTDPSTWETIWVTWAGADQLPCSSMEKKLEEDKNSLRVFSTPGAQAVLYWSPTTAVCFQGDGGRELVLHPEFPGDQGKSGQGPTHFHHHTWKHVSVTPQVVGRGPCVLAFKPKWPPLPPLVPRHHLCKPHVMLFMQHTTEDLSLTLEPGCSPSTTLWAPGRVSHLRSLGDRTWAWD